MSFIFICTYYVGPVMKHRLHPSRSRLVNNWSHVADPRRLPPVSVEIYSAVNWCRSFDLKRNLKLLKRPYSRKYNFLPQVSIVITITIMIARWWKYYEWPYTSVVILARCKLCTRNKFSTIMFMVPCVRKYGITHTPDSFHCKKLYNVISVITVWNNRAMHRAND